MVLDKKHDLKPFKVVADAIHCKKSNKIHVNCLPSRFSWIDLCHKCPVTKLE